jgi:hypothetical protein
VLGKAVAIGANRGRALESALFAPAVVLTAHPSSVLREREDATRHAALQALVDDLRVGAELLS